MLDFLPLLCCSSFHLGLLRVCLQAARRPSPCPPPLLTARAARLRQFLRALPSSSTSSCSKSNKWMLGILAKVLYRPRFRAICYSKDMLVYHGALNRTRTPTSREFKCYFPSVFDCIGVYKFSSRLPLSPHAIQVYRVTLLLNIPHPSRTNFGLRLVYRVGLGLGLVFVFV